MKSIFHPWLLPLVLPCLLVSCESRELVQEQERQQVEIARLRGELKLIEEKLKHLPPDRSQELAEARKESEAQLSEIGRLESEISELENRKRALESEFESYRSKYSLR